MIHFFDRVSSTNDLAQGDEYRHGDVVWADAQSSGRGQRGNNWISSKGLNLTFTVVVEPFEFAIKEQFSLLRITALSIVNTLAEYGLEAKIKWTNDIYIDDKKVCGVLIENQIRDGYIRKSIIGIGLNVNQVEFPSELANPTSMRVECGREFNREEVLQSLHRHLMNYAAMSSWDSLSQPYHSALYRLDEWHQYRDSHDNTFTAKIMGVASTGEITLLHRDNTSHSYLFRELHFII